MATALSLAQAAGQAFDNLYVQWLSNNLKSVLTGFWQTTIDTFPQSAPDSNPVSNWLVLIAALADPMAASFVPLAQLTQAAEYVYRVCWMASFLQSSGGITNAQATFLLAQYNAIIGF